MTFRTRHTRPEGNEDQQGQDIYHEGFIAVSVVPSGPRIPLHVRCLPVIGG